MDVIANLIVENIRDRYLNNMYKGIVLRFANWCEILEFGGWQHIIFNAFF